MHDATMAARSQATEDSTRWFYAWMALACFAIAFIGFMPTYFVPLSKGAFQAAPLTHIHGLIMFSWVTLFCVQTWLVATGRTPSHRTWGMLGIAIVTAMTCVVTAIIALRTAQVSSTGVPPGMGRSFRAFEWVVFSGLLFFVPVFWLAVVYIRKPEIHKRLILLGTISLLGAPIARWFLVLMLPATDPGAPVALMANGQPVPVAPPLWIAIPPALLGDTLLIAAMVYDWRTRGKVHPVYVIGGAIMVLMHATYIPVGNSALWLSVASALGRLGG